MAYKTKCPKCGEEDTLYVIAGKFQASGMNLGPDGFAFMDANQVDTEDETVECSACHKMFPLDEVME